MTTPATAIKDEVRVLIDLQIEPFGQPAPLTPSQLREFHDRAETIRMLCQDLNRIGTKKVNGTAVGIGVIASRLLRHDVVSTHVAKLSQRSMD